MDRCPMEVWKLIFEFACTDDGTTGCSLALAARWTKFISASVRLQSIGVKTAEQLPRVADMLESLPQDRRHTHILSISDHALCVQNEMQEEHFFTPLETHTIAAAVKRILTALASTLQALSMDLSMSASLPSTLVPVPLPALQELTVRGMLSRPTTDAPLQPLPSLKCLHIHFTSCLNAGIEGWRLLEDLPWITPSLEELHVHGLIWYGQLSQYLRHTIYSRTRQPLFNRLKIFVALSSLMDGFDDTLAQTQYEVFLWELGDLAQQDLEDKLVLVPPRGETCLRRAVTV